MEQESNHLEAATLADVKRRLSGLSCVFCGDRRCAREPIPEVVSSLGEAVCLCFACARYVDGKAAGKTLSILEERMRLLEQGRIYEEVPE